MAMASDDLQDILSRLDHLNQLIDEAHIKEDIEQVDNTISAIEQQTLQEQQELESEIAELEFILQEETLKQDTIQRIHDEKLETITRYKGEIAQCDIAIEQDLLRCKELETEIKELDRQISKKEESLSTSGKYPESIELAVYRGLGIYGLNNKRCNLQTPDGQDILSIPLEDTDLSLVTNKIWDFISK